MLTRREFGKLGLAGFIMGRPEGRPLRSVGEATIDSKVNGVRLGAQTYSFRDLPHAPGGDAVDAIIKAMVDCGIGECELWAPQVEPQFPTGARGRRGDPPSPEAVKAREDARTWRLETPLDHFRDVKKKFDTAGIPIHAYNYSPNTSYSAAETDPGFRKAKALRGPTRPAST